MRREFTVTDQRIALLKRAYVTWDPVEFGAPVIDPKRPYGNSACYYDIAEILGIALGNDDEFTDDQRSEMDRIHRETATALQVFLRVGEMRPGQYFADRYTPNWTPHWTRKGADNE